MHEQLERSVAYLSSQKALDALRIDPYWPKWDGPWWHIQCLFELGEVEKIPACSLDALIESMERRFPKFFPFKQSDLIAGADLRRDSSCHCQLGMVYQVLFAAGIDIDTRLPWTRPWFLKYQLPDGGLNCDNGVYLKPNPKSSIVSSLPPLEAVLNCTPRAFTGEENTFLERGADYLIEHELYKSTSGKVINKDWLQPCFPHFYEYSVLRGLRFLKAWSRQTNRELPDRIKHIEAEQEAQFFGPNAIRITRHSYDSERSTIFPIDLKNHRTEDAKTFELLENVSKIDTASRALWDWYRQR
jgi:hypothetical protein